MLLRQLNLYISLLYINTLDITIEFVHCPRQNVVEAVHLRYFPLMYKYSGYYNRGGNYYCIKQEMITVTLKTIFYD